MRFHYDAEADAAYLSLADDIRPGGVAKTVLCDEAGAPGVHLDFDERGRIVGVEILDARRRLPPELMRGDPDP